MGDIDIRFYMSILWRRLPYFIVIAAIPSAIGVAIAYHLPPVYRATAKILIESPQIPEQLATPTVPVNGIEQIQIIEQRMMTSSNLLNMAARLNIYADQPGLLASDVVDDMRSRTEFEQIQFDTPRGGAGATAFAIAFEATNPALAAQVANDIATLILQENIRLRTGRASDTLEFFQQDAKRLETQLRQLEGEILSFKNKNNDALPDSLEFRRSEQTTQQERLRQLEREEAALRDRRSNLVKIFEDTARVVDAGRPTTPEERMLEELRRTLAEQRAIYSDKNPNIVVLRSRIAALEDEVRAQRGAGVNVSEGSKAPSELDMQLADIDGRLSFIAQDKAAIIQDLAGLKQSILATPANEMALNSLERDYQTIQTQYSLATARLANASTGEQIELRSKGERFSVIEMATPPQKPVRSKRLKIAAGGVVGGLGLGLGFVLLMELLNKRIRRPVELVQGLEIRPFATIPYIRTGAEALNKKLAFGLGLLLIVGAFPALLFAIHYYSLPLDYWFDKLTNALGIAPPLPNPS